MNKRKTGTYYEEAAASYLEEQGVKIVDRNFRCRQGEIDLIGYHHGYLVFFEVKYRTGTGYGFAEEAVNGRKQAAICRCAYFYCYTRKIPQNQPVRYDVLAIQGDLVHWYADAFSHRTGSCCRR